MKHALTLLLAAALCGCNPNDQDATVPRRGVVWDATTGVLTAYGRRATTTVEFVWIEPGTFTMGGPDHKRTILIEGPPRTRHVQRGFWLGKHEITQGQWAAFGGEGRLSDPDLPAVRISWTQVQAFVRQLSERTGEHVHLPSETEWEYACRAGTTTPWPHGDDPRQTGTYAWFASNSGARLHAVGQKEANPWGLYDMLGNAAEWTADAASETNRVLRGGTVLSAAEGASCTCRYQFPASYGYQLAGFRLALD